MIQCNKQEIKSKLLQQGISEDKAEETYKKAQEFYVGYVGEDKEVCICRKWVQFNIKKTFAGVKQDVTAIFVGKDKNDYGALKKYKAAKELYATNPEEAIKSLKTDTQGNPLGENGYMKGKPIDLSKTTKYEYYGVAKINGGNFVNAKLSFDEPTDVPLFSVLKMRIGCSEKPDNLNLYGMEKFEIISELNEEQVQGMLKQHFNLMDVNSSFEMETSDFNNVAVIGNVVEIKITDASKSNVLTLGAKIDLDNFNVDEQKTITCWVNSDIEATEVAENVIVIGKLRTKEGKKSLNTVGIYVPEKYRKPKDLRTLNETDIKDDTELLRSNTEKFAGGDGGDDKWIQ